MSAALTRRAALSGAAASVAMVGVATAAAMPVATAAGISPELTALIDAAVRADQAGTAYDLNVYYPAQERRDAAMTAAEASLPHTTVDAGPNMLDGRIEWTTASPVKVSMARTVVEMGRSGHTLAPEHIGGARRIVAADLWRKRALARVERDHDLSDLVETSNAHGDAAAAAQCAVAAHPVTTAADLHAKLAFMVERDMGSGVDWLPELLADAARVAKAEG